jgi:hypothetical protein
MNPIATTTTALTFRVQDRPTICGTVTDTTGQYDFLDVLYFVDNNRGAFIPETVVYSYSNETKEYNIILDKEFEVYSYTQLSLIVMQDSRVNALLDNGISAIGTQSDTLNTISATIRAKGWCKIDSEWLAYTFDGTTITFSERGLFGTTPAAHSASAQVDFSFSKHTCTPRFPFMVKDKTQL